MGRATYALTVKIGALQDASYNRNLNKAMRNLDSLESTAKRVATGVATAFAAVNITRLAEDAVTTYSEFEQAMKNTAAIADASVAEYEKMENAARSAGRATTKTATEAAEAMGYMALAGWDAQESVDGLMPILRLAESTGAELQQTSDLVTDSMSALGLGVSDIETYLDMLAAGNNNANTTAIMLMQSLTKTGGAAKVLGASLEDTITAVGILANNGTKAEEGGTAMNSMLTRIATNDKALEALEKIGVDIYKANGDFIGLKNTLVEIDTALSGMSTEDRTAILKQIAGTRYFSRMEYLLAGVREGADGAASAWDNLESKVVNSEGALDRMNAKVTHTLPSAWERVKSAVNDTKIGVVDEFGEDATLMLDNLAQRIPLITDSITDFLDDNKKEIYDALESGGDMLENLCDTSMKMVAFLLDNEGAVVGSLTAIGSALLIKKTVNSATSIVTFISSMTTPLGVIAGLSAAVGVIAGVSTAIRKANEAAVDANLDEHFGSIVLSLEDLKDVAAEIVKGDDLETITQMLESVGDTESELRDVKRVLEEIQTGSWKINAGFTFDQDDSEVYVSKIEDYVGQVQEYVDAQGYQVRIATTLLFGTDSEQSEESSQYYAKLDKQVKRLSDKISESIDKAMEDGIIDADEDALIQATIEKMNRITNRISAAQAEASMQAIQLKYSGTDLDEQTFMELEDEISKSVEESADAALQAYESAMTMYNDKLKNDKSYTQEDYNRDQQAAELAYFNKKAEYVSQGASYLIDTINSSYPELSDEVKRAQQILDEALAGDLPDKIKQAIESDDLISFDYLFEDLGKSTMISDEATRGAIEKLREQMNPVKEELEQLAQEYVEAGKEIPKDIVDQLNSINILGALSGDWKSVWSVIGVDIKSDPEYTDLLDTLKQNGEFIPESIADAIIENEQSITASVDGMYAYSNQYLEQVFSQGFDLETDVRFTYNVRGQNQKTALENIDLFSNPVTPHALGGIFDTPHLGLLAEDGPEAYIPLDGSNRAVSIWERAGQMLGTMGKQSRDEKLYAGLVMNTGNDKKIEQAGPSIQIMYNPNITIKGNVSEHEVQKAVSLGAEDVLKIIKDYTSGQARVSYRRK